MQSRTTLCSRAYVELFATTLQGLPPGRRAPGWRPSAGGATRACPGPRRSPGPGPWFIARPRAGIDPHQHQGVVRSADQTPPVAAKATRMGPRLSRSRSLRELVRLASTTGISLFIALDSTPTAPPGSTAVPPKSREKAANPLSRGHLSLLEWFEILDYISRLL
jgi:hypothetical protein